MSFTKHLAVVLSGALSLALPAKAETELTMYYPIAVGGSLTTVVDGIVAGFEAANPDIKVNAIYSGNYDDTRVRALSAGCVCDLIASSAWSFLGRAAARRFSCLECRKNVTATI